MCRKQVHRLSSSMATGEEWSSPRRHRFVCAGGAYSPNRYIDATLCALVEHTRTGSTGGCAVIAIIRVTFRAGEPRYCPCGNSGPSFSEVRWKWSHCEKGSPQEVEGEVNCTNWSMIIAFFYSVCWKILLVTFAEVVSRVYSLACCCILVNNNSNIRYIPACTIVNFYCKIKYLKLIIGQQWL